MWAAVLFFAFAAAQDPVRIGIMALLISRPRPMSNLFAYWLGLMATGYGAALAALFLLHDFLFPVTRVVNSIAAQPAVPAIQVALGVLAISAAAVLAASSSEHQTPYALMPGGDSSVVVLQPKTPTIFSRLPFPRVSWTALLDGRSLRVPFVAGLCTSTQLIEFWGAMLVILASGAGAGTQIVAALIFTLVAFALIEIPLVSHLISPAKTQVVVTQVRDWLRARRRPIFVFVLSVFGVLMVAKGLARL